MAHYAEEGYAKTMHAAQKLYAQLQIFDPCSMYATSTFGSESDEGIGFAVHIAQQR
jgi:hypothetical protein